jgi:hypothetical protein
MINFLNQLDPADWTYGCEMQFGDWDTRKLDPAFGIDRREHGNMNSNGIAADPSGKSYPYGGEVLTPWGYSPASQGEKLQLFLDLHPNAALNHRSSLHVHIGVPGLAENLPALKRINRYNRIWLPTILDRIEPMPRPKIERVEERGEEFAGRLRRWRKRVTSHHTITTEARVILMNEANTLPEFFEACVSRNGKGVPNWHFLCRPAVNLIRLYKIGKGDHPTIEFRHFPGTLDPEVLTEAVAWCRDYLAFALADKDPTLLLVGYLTRGLLPMPTPEYDHARELNFRRTCFDGTLSRETIEENIRYILDSLLLNESPLPVAG